MREDILDKIVARATLGIRSARPYVPGKPTEELRRERSFSKDFHIVKLASNENPLGISPKALAAIKAHLEKLELYPDAAGFYLKEKLSKHHNVGLNNILLGNGSENILDMIARALLSPEDEVVLSEYCFPQFSLVTTLAGATIKYAPVGEMLAQDLDSLIAALSSKTRLVIIGNPDNPTGSFLTLYQLGELRRAMPEEAVLIVDEAYHGLVTRHEYKSTLDVDQPFNNCKQPIITSRTFSKAQGLAGIRCAYAIMPEKLYELIYRVKLPFNVNTLAQVAAFAALDDDEHVNRTCELLKVEKPYLVAECQRLGFRVIEGAANFVLVDTSPTLSKVITDKLLDRGVIVRPLMGPDNHSYFRLSVGMHEDNLRFVGALEEIVMEMKK